MLSGRERVHSWYQTWTKIRSYADECLCESSYLLQRYLAIEREVLRVVLIIRVLNYPDLRRETCRRTRRRT